MSLEASGDLAFDIVELALWTPGDDEVHPLREVRFRANSWLPDEVATLRRMFADDMGFEEIAQHLGRGRAGVADKAWSLGLRRNSSRPWNELEDALLVERYGMIAAAVLAQELGRSCPSVYVRAQLLGLTEGKPPAWTPWEDAQLAAGYAAAKAVGQIASLIGRPFSGVISRAKILGLRHPGKPDDWSDEEMQRALELAEEGHRYLAIIEMLVAEGFPRRTKNGFGKRIRILGYGRGWGREWSADEQELLCRAYARGDNLRRLAGQLGRKPGSLKWKAEQLGLQGGHPNHDGFRQGPAWSEDDDMFLRENYGRMKTKDIARHLRRPKMGVYCRAFTLGLKTGRCGPYTADERHAYQIAYDQGIAIADLAIALDREAMTVSKYATDKLGLHFGRRSRCRPPLTLNQILALEPRENR